MTVINLRATNGAGKSTVARKLIDLDREAHEVKLAGYITPAGKPRYTVGTIVPSLELIVVGSYRTPCGGCDGIKTQDLVKTSVLTALDIHKARHVFFEGVIVATLFSGYLELSKKLPERRQQFIWAYLDTPIEKCLERIYKRNGGKPIKEDLVRDKFRSIETTRRKAEEAGETTATIHYRRAIADIRELLR